MDRMLFCNPNKKAEYLSTRELSDDLIINYRDAIFHFNSTIERDYLKMEDNNLHSNILRLTTDAKDLFLEYDRELVDLQNSDNEIHYYRGMYAKQRTYTPRFALIIEVIDCITNNKKADIITLNSYDKAIKLSRYFINQAKVNKQENVVNSKIQDVYNSISSKPNKEIALALVKAFPKESITKVAETMNVSRNTIYKYLK